MNICDLLEEVRRRCPNETMPSSYIVLDLETTGLNPQQCRAVQYGVCIVKDDLVVDSWAAIVKYPYNITISAEAMKVHKITPERMEAEGVPMGELMPALVTLFRTARRNGTMFMGHNFGAFDRWIIERDCAEFADSFKFGDNEFIDSGGLIKASQLPDVEFRHDESLASFFERVREIRARGVLWRLSWCAEQYGLVKEGVDIDALHDAGVDARTVHLLYQSFLTLMEGRCGGKNADRRD